MSHILQTIQKQVYFGFYLDSINGERESMEQCISDIKHWMLSRKLKMNDAKTEYILSCTQQQLAKCTNTSINIGDSVVQATDCVHNVGCLLR